MRDAKWGQIPRSDVSRGWGLFRAISNRALNLLAKHLPMFPEYRSRLHRLRGVSVGQRVFIGIDVLIDDAEPEAVTIESDVTILARTVLLAHSYYPHHLQTVLAEAVSRHGITIKRGAYVGVGAIILPGVTIGENAVIGAGAVVTEDVPAGVLAVGVPARVVRTFDPEELR